jgi:KDO2-lipid IV(A) lauroyltransferase
MKFIGTWIVGLLLRSILFLVGIMPRFVLCGLSNGLAFLTQRVVGYRRGVVMDNLRRAFPERSERELRRIAVSSYRALFDTMLNIFRIRYASQKRVLRTMHCKNTALLQRLYDEGKNGIILAGHYSCWEYIGVLQRDIKHQTVAAYQPLSFAPLENVIAEGRMRFGAKMAKLNDIFRVLFAYQKQGIKTMTLMVSDQSPARGSCTHWLTLLGQLTPVFVTPERIAQKTEAAVMYLRIVEKKRFCYEYELVLLTENAAQEAEMVTTKRFYAELEKDLCRTPQLWMWTHRRWKNQYLFETEKKYF